jgi:hypothetical protein
MPFFVPLMINICFLCKFFERRNSALLTAKKRKVLRILSEG